MTAIDYTTFAKIFATIFSLEESSLVVESQSQFADIEQLEFQRKFWKM